MGFASAILKNRNLKEPFICMTQLNNTINNDGLYRTDLSPNIEQISGYNDVQTLFTIQN